MLKLIYIISIALAQVFVPLIVAADELNTEPSAEAIRLNNEAVAAQKKLYLWRNSKIVGVPSTLEDSDYKSVVDKFEAASKFAPNYFFARQNLAIAHNNFALFLCKHDHNSKEALKELHAAVYLDPNNVVTSQSLSGFIRDVLKMDPKNSITRTKLAEQASNGNDVFGTIVEYRAALKLRNESSIHKKLGDAYRLLGDKDNAVAEYAAACRNTNE